MRWHSTVPIPGPTSTSPFLYQKPPPTHPTLSIQMLAALGQSLATPSAAIYAPPARMTHLPDRHLGRALQLRSLPPHSPPLPPSPAPSLSQTSSDPAHAPYRWTLQSRYPHHPRPHSISLPHSNNSHPKSAFPLPSLNHSHSNLTPPHPPTLHLPPDPQHPPPPIIARHPAGIKIPSSTFKPFSTR